MFGFNRNVNIEDSYIYVDNIFTGIKLENGRYFDYYGNTIEYYQNKDLHLVLYLSNFLSRKEYYQCEQIFGYSNFQDYNGPIRFKYNEYEFTINSNGHIFINGKDTKIFQYENGRSYSNQYGTEIKELKGKELKDLFNEQYLERLLELDRRSKRTLGRGQERNNQDFEQEMSL